MIFIGIDPGKSGALAFIRDGEEAAIPLPFIGDEFNALELRRILDSWEDEMTVILEKVHAMPKQGVVSVFTFGKLYGELRGIVKSLGIRLVEPTPQQWKKVVLAGMDWKGRKECSAEYVMKKYPEVNLFPGKKRVAHDGVADAVCLAEYGRLVHG